VRRQARLEDVHLTDPTRPSDLPVGIACAFFSTVGIWALIFMGGYFIYGRTTLGAVAAAVSVVCGGTLALLWRRLSMR
jgi:hypothetical protein